MKKPAKYILFKQGFKTSKKQIFTLATAMFVVMFIIIILPQNVPVPKYKPVSELELEAKMMDASDRLARAATLVERQTAARNISTIKASMYDANPVMEAIKKNRALSFLRIILLLTIVGLGGAMISLAVCQHQKLIAARSVESGSAKKNPDSV